MAVRKVSTIFTVDGEREYRDKVTEINSALKTYSAELKAVDEACKGQANTLSALRDKTDALERVQQSLTAKQTAITAAMQNCRDSADKYRAKIVELNAAIASGDGKQNELQSELAETEAKLKASEDGVMRWRAALASNDAAITKNGRELETFRGYLGEAENSADGLARSIDNTGKKVKEAGEASVEAGKKAEQSVDTVANALLAAGLKQTFDKIVVAVRECVDAAIEWESAWTGVKKTVDGTDEQLAAVRSGLQKLSEEIPLTKTEIAGIAEAAGQLGIATDNIVVFTEVMAMLGSTTNLSSDEAATSIAKFANITGLLSSEYSNLGSAVVDLGNNMATTERDIMNMAMRIAAAGTQVGLSESQILGYSAALSSVGLEAEAGGTAFSTAIKKMQIAVETGSKDLSAFADIAGMTSDEFKKLWNTDVEAAITAFIQGLGSVSEKGESTIVMLEDLGFQNVRISDAFTRLANNSTLVTDALYTANTAWSENTALTKEAETRYATTESKIVLMNNAIDNLKVAVGEDFTKAITPAIDGITDMTNGLAGVVEESPEATAALAALAGGVGALTLSLGGMAIAGTVKTAIAGLGAAAAGVALPVAGVIAGVAAMAAGVAVLSANMDNTDEEARKFAESMKELRKSYEEGEAAYDSRVESIKQERTETDALISKLNELLSVNDKTLGQKAAITSLVDELNTRIPELGLKYDNVADSINLSTEALKEFALVSMETAKAEEVANRLKEAYIAQYQAQEEAFEKEKELSAAKNKLAEAEIAYNEAVASSSPDLYDLARTFEKASDRVTKLNQGLDDANYTLGKATGEVLSLEREYENLTPSLEKNKQKTEEATRTQKKAAEVIEETTESVEDLKSSLESLETTYSEAEDGVNELGEAVKTALKEQAKQIHTDKVEALNKAYEAEQAASKDKIELWEEETDERKRLLEEVTAATVAELDKQIAAIEGRTAKENADKAAAERKAERDGYTAEIAAATDEVSGYNEWFDTVLAGYTERSAGIVNEYAAQLADAEADKARIISESQAAVAAVTADYEARLSELESGSTEYVELKAEMSRKVAEANADMITAELDANERINAIKTAQANAEFALAEEKEKALTRIADESRDLMKKQREDAHEQVKVIAEAEKKLATETAEYLQAENEKQRDEAVGKIEELKKSVEDYADETSKQYDAMFTAQKKSETERMESRKNFYEAEKEAAKKAYEDATTEYQLQLDTYKAMTELSQTEILELLEKYTPEWKTKGQTFAVMLRDGWTSPEKKFEDCVGDSVTAAIIHLNDLQTKIDETTAKIAELEAAASGSIDIFMAESGEASGKNYAAGTAEGVKAGTNEGIFAAKRLAQGIKGAVDEELIINSPSKVGYYQGDMYVQGILNALDDGEISLSEATARLAKVMAAELESIHAAEELGYGTAEIIDMHEAFNADADAAKEAILARSDAGKELAAAQAEYDRLKSQQTYDGEYVFGLHEATMALQMAQEEYNKLKNEQQAQLDYDYEMREADGEVGKYIQIRNKGTEMVYQELLPEAANEFRSLDEYLSYVSAFRETRTAGSLRNNDASMSLMNVFYLMMRDEKYRYRSLEELISIFEIFFGPRSGWGQADIDAEYARLTSTNFYQLQKSAYNDTGDSFTLSPEYTAQLSAQLMAAQVQMNRSASELYSVPMRSGNGFGGSGGGESVVNVGGVTVVSPEMSPYQTQKAVERGVREALKL